MLRGAYSFSYPTLARAKKRMLEGAYSFSYPTLARAKMRMLGEITEPMQPT
jgi:hypothetical protein